MENRRIWSFLLTDNIQSLLTESLSASTDAFLREWFTHDEYTQLSRLTLWQRENRICAHVAAKKMLTKLLLVSPHDITINHYPSGAPYACVAGESYPLSLSHVRNYGVAFTSLSFNRHIGIDAVYDWGQPIADLIPRIATSAEQEWLVRGERRRFFSLWALKEAVIKAWGVGMSIAPWDIEVVFDSHSAETFTIKHLGLRFPSLCGTVMGTMSSPMVFGFAWSDQLADVCCQERLAARGLHLGC